MGHGNKEWESLSNRRKPVEKFQAGTWERVNVPPIMIKATPSMKGELLALIKEKGPVSLDELASSFTGIARKNLASMANKLLVAGKVKRVTRGVYK